IKTLVSKPEKESLDVSEAPIIMVGVTTIMAIIILVTGLFPNILIEMANGASESLIKGLDYYIRALIP
ncbi:hypothetical protein KEJ23_08300, partial [Candidatus Bathyarchaeota archaeon]|nr:hypothetical protein [Candidatus Bathyarchaeota archaeon]